MEKDTEQELYLQILPNIFDINEENVDSLFNKIKENEQKLKTEQYYKFVLRALEYALKIRPKQSDSIFSLLSKISKLTNYVPSLILSTEHFQKLTEKDCEACNEESGIRSFIKQEELEMDDFNRSVFKRGKPCFSSDDTSEAIKEDNVEELIKQSSKSDFNPNKEYKIDSGDAISFVNKKRKSVTYMQLMAYFGSVKCFKYALMDGSFNQDDLNEFAIAGGNNEIIQLLKQKGVSFDNCYTISVKFRRDEIREWLLSDYVCEKLNPFDAITAFDFSEIKDNDLIKEVVYLYSQDVDITIGAFLYCKIKTSDIIINNCPDLFRELCHIRNSDKPLAIYHNAFVNGNVEYLRFLLEKKPLRGDDLQYESCGNGWFLNEAADCVNYKHGKYISNQREMLKMLSTFYNINEFSGYVHDEFYTPLTKACENGDLSLVKFIVEELGADVNAQDDEYRARKNSTALITALSSKHFDIAKYLVKECGADVNAQDNYGNTPSSLGIDQILS